jgi:hypothetical protein
MTVVQSKIRNSLKVKINKKGDGSVVCSKFAIAQFGPLGAKCLPRVFGD